MPGDRSNYDTPQGYELSGLLFNAGVSNQRPAEQFQPGLPSQFNAGRPGAAPYSVPLELIEQLGRAPQQPEWAPAAPMPMPVVPQQQIMQQAPVGAYQMPVEPRFDLMNDPSVRQYAAMHRMMQQSLMDWQPRDAREQAERFQGLNMLEQDRRRAIERLGFDPLTLPPLQTRMNHMLANPRRQGYHQGR